MLCHLACLSPTKFIGVSNFNKEQVGRIISNSRIKPAANQVEPHVYLQQPELVKYCQDNGIVVISYSSLGNPCVNAWLKKFGKSGLPGYMNLLNDTTVKRIAEKYNKSSAQVLLKFLLQKNIAIIPKSVNTKRIKENYNLFDFSLNINDLKALENLDKGGDKTSYKWNIISGILEHPEYPFPKKPT